jgi:cell division protein DivIC
MSQKKVRNKKPMTLNRLFKNVFSMVLVLVSVFLIQSSVKSWSKVSKSKQEIKILEAELLALDEEASNLEGLKSKLSDPNYVQNYARGKHLMTKSDEQVFVLPKASE